MKPAASPVVRATRLLDKIRERICNKRHILRTEHVYVQCHGLRPRVTLGLQEVEVFQAMLANERRPFELLAGWRLRVVIGRSTRTALGQ